MPPAQQQNPDNNPNQQQTHQEDPSPTIGQKPQFAIPQQQAHAGEGRPQIQRTRPVESQSSQDVTANKDSKNLPQKGFPSEEYGYQDLLYNFAENGVIPPELYEHQCLIEALLWQQLNDYALAEAVEARANEGYQCMCWFTTCYTTEGSAHKTTIPELSTDATSTNGLCILYINSKPTVSPHF
ncbi:unnamed protein product [Boreogadus saida]